VPNIVSGPVAVELSGNCCQSPALELAPSAVRSVANNAGKIGRPNGSAAAGSPVLIGEVPASTIEPGYGVTPGSAPSGSACSSVVNTPTCVFAPVPKIPACASTVLSLKSTDER